MITKFPVCPDKKGGGHKKTARKTAFEICTKLVNGETTTKVAKDHGVSVAVVRSMFSKVTRECNRPEYSSGPGSYLGPLISQAREDPTKYLAALKKWHDNP